MLFPCGGRSSAFVPTAEWRLLRQPHEFEAETVQGPPPALEPRSSRRVRTENSKVNLERAVDKYLVCPPPPLSLSRPSSALWYIFSLSCLQLSAQAHYHRPPPPPFHRTAPPSRQHHLPFASSPLAVNRPPTRLRSTAATNCHRSLAVPTPAHYVPHQLYVYPSPYSG